VLAIKNESEFLIKASGIRLVTDEKFTSGGTCARVAKLNMSLQKKDVARLEFGRGANNRAQRSDEHLGESQLAACRIPPAEQERSNCYTMQKCSR